MKTSEIVQSMRKEADKNITKNKLKTIVAFSAVTAITIAALCISSDVTYARDLDSAARTYTTTIKSIGQIMSVAGIIVGGICMQIPGVTMFGRHVLAGGLIGGVCSFGAPAFAALLTTVFGSG